MTNRKLFRMKHEPCTGRCYTPGEVLSLSGLGLDTAQASALLADIIEIHEPACGREQLAFSLDVDEQLGIYIGVFAHFGQTETVSAATALDCIVSLIAAAKLWYATDEAQQLLAANPGDGKDACEHGKDHDLAAFALRHSGLSHDEQSAVLEAVSAKLVA